MVDEHHVALECSCLKATDATCTMGGEMTATMTISASMATTIVADSEITSPPAAASCLDSVGAVVGSGPLYIVTLGTCDCEDLDDTWIAQITANGETYYYSISSIDGCDLTLQYTSSTDSVDRQIEAGDDIRLLGDSGETLPILTNALDMSATLSFLAEVEARLSAFVPLEVEFEAEFEIEDGITVTYAMGETLCLEANFNVPDMDKVAGEFGDFYCQEKLYPKSDLSVASGFDSFVGPYSESSGLFGYIDEGVYEGVLKDGGDSVILSDDANTFIQPDTVNTEGLFQYNCELTNLNVRPDQTAFRMRVAAPLENYESSAAPLYTVYNIQLLDPSGNLIVKYKDIQVRGDSPTGNPKYSTYSSLPETNRMDDYDWERRTQPHMQMVSGYQLGFSVRAVSLDDPFSLGFDGGFEENYILPAILTDGSGNNYLSLDGAPLSTQEVKFLNPTNGFKVSAIEICSSGGFGPRREDYFPFFMEVPVIGRRLERAVRAKFMPLNDFDTTLYPSTDNVWTDDVGSLEGSPLGVTNEDVCGAQSLIDILSVPNERQYIKLQTTDFADSGKLILRFGECVTDVDEITLGAFNYEFDQSTKKIWFSPSGAFNVENRRPKIHRNDSLFYTVDTITLKVLAKKAIGSRDYVLDVVGYSEDKLLHNTSPSGGFLQNPSGVCLNSVVIGTIGNHPVVSGFYSDDDDFVIAGGSLSEHEDYWEASGNSGGDHHRLTQYPMVSGTDFEWYEVPLEILDDDVRLGLSQDYSMSSYLEKIYLDIFPLPSGAAIAYAELCVRYKPSNALNFYTQGGVKFGKAQDGRSEGSFFPTIMGSGDDILNAGSGYGPLSLISQPHLYTSDDTIKTNYARRWRGVEGTVRGPFDPDMFGFGFENPTIDYPFLSGYYRFDNVDSMYVQSTDLGPDGLGTTSGLFATAPEIYQNIGWRYSSGTLFQNELPGFSGDYTTTDWTSMASGATNFVSNPLYGKIADAFDRVVRISQDTQNINFGNVSAASGFAIFARFTPDATVSGVGYDLFESGIIFSKWDTPSQLDFALAYSGGFLTGYARDINDNIISIADTVPFSGYQFPVNVILTYNDHESSGLKLYVDNEFLSPFTVLRASSAPFHKADTNADLVLGWSAGSGVGMNMLVSEFGISSWSSGVDTLYGSGTNIVETNSDWTYKQVTAEKFLENSRVKYFDPNESYAKDRYKLWDRVNENTYDSWELGDFQHCQFDLAFSKWDVRPNTEQIVFDISHSGTSYVASVDSAIPSNLDSGVAYHTQIENDFLRFHLSDVPSSFYSVNRRITKNVPCDYKFSERAIVVETVVSHETGHGIQWSGCEDIAPSGPRMIVSLYTKAQDPYWTPDEPNWGLVNRKVHYLMPSSCIQRLDSTFTYDDLCDETEEWAIFPEEPRIKDFTERYFSDDINDMFVQYDLVYPSGPAFQSRIELHTSHVRMADTNLCDVDVSGTMNLFASGAFPSSSELVLNIGGNPTGESGIFPLQIQTPLPYDIFTTAPSGFVLSVSGAFTANNALNLFTPNQSGNAILSLTISGEMPTGLSSSMFLNLPVILGTHDSSDDTSPITSIAGEGSFFGMPLTAFNADVAMSPDGPILRLNTFGSSSGNTGVRDTVPLTLWNNLTELTRMGGSGNVNLSLRGGNAATNRRFVGDMPLFINAPNILSPEMPLYIHSPRVSAENSGTMNLITANYNASAGSAFGLWYNNSYGTGIEIGDNSNFTLPISNEIRGVDLTAYGSCTGDSPSKAVDLALITDCTIWRPEVCNDGGIFRAKQTYTNSGVINFSGGFGYSGNYYGVRKFSDLIPSVAYTATMKIKTGSTDTIPVPPTLEEWGYGMCGPEQGGCCVEDCGQSLVFSGVKFVGDDAQSVAPSANLAVDSALIVASGRAVSGEYGASVSVKGDLMAVASPNLTIPEFDQYRLDASGDADPGFVDVSGAGAVFLYRRGTDVAGASAAWSLIEPLMLPTGFRKDYIQRSATKLLTFDTFSISGNKWQIGQEGRQFGSSLDMAVSGDREVVVIGAPRADWQREFSDLATSGIPTAGIVFADLFDYDIQEISAVATTASRFNILWKYFSAPWGAGSGEWYAEINPKIMVLQLTYSHKNYPVVPTDQSSWFVHKYIPRLDDLELLKEIGSGLLGGSGSLTDWIVAARPVISDQQYSGVLDAFFTSFPSGQPTLYSGIPAIMGMFKEQTGSTAGALKYADVSGNTVNIYDRFSDFYLDHSSISGVYDQTTGFAQSGHLNTVVGQSENWAATASALLADTFDSGRLATTYTNSTLNRNFISSGVGQDWGDTHGSILTEFQVPPASGGRVYVFEKERDNFNCIQVIISPNDVADLSSEVADIFGSTYSKTYNDRFGHSVGISANADIISVGSPFNHVSCRVFERNETENQRVYDSVLSWCQANSKTSASEYYGQIVLLSGVETAKTATYDFLTSSERFEFRNDINFWDSLPQPYTPSYSYGYGDIEYIGTRQFLPNAFAGTSRLGWSTSVNDEGDVVAFGAPTDSFNEFEDVNVWGDTHMRWASHVNAGAVRMFESRKYHPHSGVVEFGLFGNLDRTSHPTERASGYYDQMDLFFGSGADGTSTYQGKYWRRTDFSEIELPSDAGLAFIMTPELDSASDEIIDNIKNWLALGDRNLVLVGNDPIWEENGLYADSNEIVNRILEKLGSRMRIHAARNEEYALSGCIGQQDINDNKYNITKAKIPSHSTGATIGRGNYYGKGFGDIRISLERDGLGDFYDEMNCPEGATCNGSPPPIVNVRCEFPLGHEQDLRAEWTEQCVKTTPKTCSVVTYQKNWPLLFSSYSVSCDNPPSPLFIKPNQEPVPILTTMEHLPPSSWLLPDTSGYFCDYRTIYEYRVSQEGTSQTTFNEHNIDVVEFNIEEDENSDASGNYNSLTYNGHFFDPNALNGRDGLLQAVGDSYYPEHLERQEIRTIYPESILALVESGKKSDGTLNNSRVYIVATQWSEDDASRGIDAATDNDDKNTEFYMNMVRKDCVNAPLGIQINGFTGRTSLENAYYLKDEVTTDGHGLGDKLTVEFTPNGGGFTQNQEISDINGLVDFVWIAHPSGKPSVSDLNELQSWLDLGDKKLIITYNAALPETAQEIAENVDYLCSGLNITSRPMFVPSVGEYFITESIIDNSGQNNNELTDSISGCVNGYVFTSPNYQTSTAVSGVHFSLDTLGTDNDPKESSGQALFDKSRFVPLSGGLDWEEILWFEDDVTEEYTVYPTNRYHIDADAAIEFPTVVGSGYRMWINWVSEKTSEKFDICGNISGVFFSPEGASGNEASFIPEVLDGSRCGSRVDLSKTTVLIPHQTEYDFVAGGDRMAVTLSTSVWRDNIPEGELIDGVLPATPRILSISGCFLPITTETVITTTSGKFPLRVEEFNCRWEVNAAQSGVVPGVSRPVMHKSELYCADDIEEQCAHLGEALIEDGPVIAAEEFENFSAFSAGNRRSKIIVISDSTLLQGQCPAYRGAALSGNQEFIRSLYPESLSTEVEGRNWFFSQKLRGPERGSAAKYHAVSGAAVSNICSPLYGGAGIVGSLGNYYDDEDTYDPTTVVRPKELKGDAIKQRGIDFFNNDALGTHGVYPRFSGDFLNINPTEWYEGLLGYSGEKLDFITDAQIGGGMNDLMRINNTDYLDLDVYYSGCLGDLFGYSVDLSANKLAVGTPFNGYYTEGAISGVSGIVQWHEIENDPSRSGMRVAEDGGAGAVFVYDRTGSGENVVAEFLPWEFTQKIKPNSLNVGITDFSPNPKAALTTQRGTHDFEDGGYIIEYARRSDNFGFSVSIDCDMIAVGAPNHDFETLHDHIYSGALQPSGLNTAFQHKSFNAEFDIPQHSFYDLGDSGVRNQYSGSGVMVLNNGTVFNYRNEMVDFGTRTQSWIFAEKLYAQGYNDRTQTQYVSDGLGGFDLTASGTENDNFGRSVSINRSGRGDSDYVLSVGAPRHYWSTSGNHPTSGLLDAGAAYSFDAMLRGQVPSIPNSGGWIEAHVFGEYKERTATDRLETRVYQNVSGDSLTYQVSGLIFSNENGEIFLEVSGFDPSSKGFVAHRPYVQEVDLKVFPSIPASSPFNLVTSGLQVDSSGSMNMSLVGPDEANVYNTMNLYQNAVLGQSSGTMNMFTEAPSGHSGILNLNLTNNQVTDSLSLRIRGY